MSSQGLFPTGLHRAKASMRTIRCEIEVRRAKRRLCGGDVGIFKDIGVSSGNVEWLVRNGRADRRRQAWREH